MNIMPIEGLSLQRAPVETKPGGEGGPEVGFPWPPAGPPVRYCTNVDEINLTDQGGQTVCTLAGICTDFRAHLTNIDNSVTRVTVASSMRIFARWSQWIKDTDDPASWTPQIFFWQEFFDRGHFDDPAHSHVIPLGWTERVCGKNIYFRPAMWPAQYSDVKPEHLWLDDPLPTFDDRGYLIYQYDRRLSGFCGI